MTEEPETSPSPENTLEAASTSDSAPAAQPASEAPPAIEVHNLVKTYGVLRAVDNLSFEVAQGQIVGFLGPNGAGKSTSMRIICGLMAATSGSAFVCGHSVAANPNAAKRCIGYMPEHNPLPEDMRVVEYLRYRARLKEIPRRNLKAAVDEAMEVCDLQRKARRRVIGALSKGFRQRVGIADAILGNPPVIVMDEPTIGLDPHQILGIRKLIDSLRGRMTVILSSHILPEIEMSCDKVVIINQGRIVADGSPKALRSEFLPETRYRLRLQGDVEKLKPLLAEVDPKLQITETSEPDEDGFCKYFVETPESTDLAEPIIHKIRNSSDLRIREIARVRPTLEDIFMSATKRSWDETIAG